MVIMFMQSTINTDLMENMTLCELKVNFKKLGALHGFRCVHNGYSCLNIMYTVHYGRLSMT